MGVGVAILIFPSELLCQGELERKSDEPIHEEKHQVKAHFATCNNLVFL